MSENLPWDASSYVANSLSRWGLFTLVQGESIPYISLVSQNHILSDHRQSSTYSSDFH